MISNTQTLKLGYRMLFFALVFTVINISLNGWDPLQMIAWPLGFISFLVLAKASSTPHNNRLFVAAICIACGAVPSTISVLIDEDHDSSTGFTLFLGALSLAHTIGLVLLSRFTLGWIQECGSKTLRRLWFVFTGLFIFTAILTPVGVILDILNMPIDLNYSIYITDRPDMLPLALLIAVPLAALFVGIFVGLWKTGTLAEHVTVSPEDKSDETMPA